MAGCFSVIRQMTSPLGATLPPKCPSGWGQRGQYPPDIVPKLQWTAGSLNRSPLPFPFRHCSQRGICKQQNKFCCLPQAPPCHLSGHKARIPSFPPIPGAHSGALRCATMYGANAPRELNFLIWGCCVSCKGFGCRKVLPTLFPVFPSPKGGKKPGAEWLGFPVVIHCALPLYRGVKGFTLLHSQPLTSPEKFFERSA